MSENASDYSWQERAILEVLHENGEEMCCDDIVACSGNRLDAYSIRKWLMKMVLHCDIQINLKPSNGRYAKVLRNYYRITEQGISVLVNIALAKQEIKVP